MKIGYVAPVLDGTGYSHAAIHTILALDAAGADVLVRPVKLSGQTIEPPKRIHELIAKAWAKPDVVIQNLLPPMMAYQGGFKNLGYFYTETSNFRSSLWQHHLNTLDGVLVSSEGCLASCKESGVTVPTSKIPIACDPTIFKQDWTPTLKLPVGSEFVFYNIGDFSARKGMRQLITAYLAEFSKYDNVLLVLKTYIEMTSPQDSVKKIHAEIEDIKKNLRKSAVDQYPPILILPHYMQEDKIRALHQHGHCFVTCEAGAAWNIPCFEALGFQNQVIVCEEGGQTEYLPWNGAKDGIIALDNHPEIVSGMGQCMYPGIYTCNETWHGSSTYQLAAAMRMAYLNDKIKINRDALIERFSYRHAGPDILHTIEELV